MVGDGHGDASRPYVSPVLEDEELQADIDASEDLPPRDVEANNLPVWLQESAKAYRWAWVPLPLRKAGRATVNWIKGPDPPHMLLLKPLFPRIQELPVQYLDHFFPKRRHKVSLLMLLYISWFLPWFLVLLHSRSSGYIEGYGQLHTLSCRNNFWYVYEPHSLIRSY